MKNRRSLASRLFSPLSMKGIRYANYAAVSFVLILGVIMASLLSQLEHILSTYSDIESDAAASFVLNALYRMKFLIPTALIGIALFVLLGTLGQRRQLQSEMVPLLAQIQWLETEQYGRKRFMRQDDGLQPVMLALHELADRLRERSDS